MNLGLFSYLGASLAYVLFAILLLSSWRSSRQGQFLTIMAVISAIWAALSAKMAVDRSFPVWFYQIFEILRYISWYIFLFKLLAPMAAENISYQKFILWAQPFSICFAGLLLLAEESFVVAKLPIFLLSGHVILALIGLALVEQLYRNTAIRHRWSIKYLFLGAGGIFAFDFYMYVDAVLFYRIHKNLWEARGIVNLVAVPMLAIAAARNHNWALKIFVSRDIVLTTTTIMIGAIYLLVMSGAGFYLREYGGDWGQIIQVVFLSFAVALLAVLLFSGQVRAHFRV